MTEEWEVYNVQMESAYCCNEYIFARPVEVALLEISYTDVISSLCTIINCSITDLHIGTITTTRTITCIICCGIRTNLQQALT